MAGVKGAVRIPPQLLHGRSHAATTPALASTLLLPASAPAPASTKSTRSYWGARRCVKADRIARLLQQLQRRVLPRFLLAAGPRRGGACSLELAAVDHEAAAAPAADRQAGGSEQVRCSGIVQCADVVQG
jgi:hypothetical protein